MVLVSPERKYWIGLSLFGFLVSVALIVTKVLERKPISTVPLVAAVCFAAALVVAVRARLEVMDGRLHDRLWPLRSQGFDIAEIESVSVGRAPGAWPGMLLITTLRDDREVALRSTTAHLLFPSRTELSELAELAATLKAASARGD